MSRLKEICVCSLFGVIMFISKLMLDALPNIHMIAMFIGLFTLLFRSRALISIYVFVFLTGLYGGFAVWWVSYLYVWTILWGAFMLLPKNMPTGIAVPVYTLICTLHGLLFGLLTAPVNVLLMGLGVKAIIPWVISGLSFDFLHAVGNFGFSLLIVPVSKPLRKEIDI